MRKGRKQADCSFQNLGSEGKEKKVTRGECAVKEEGLFCVIWERFENMSLLRGRSTSARKGVQMW